MWASDVVGVLSVCVPWLAVVHGESGTDRAGPRRSEREREGAE
jgi:hypothetical protein